MDSGQPPVLESLSQYGSLISGVLFGAGWWLWIDAVVHSKTVLDQDFTPLFLVPGLIATFAALLMSCVKRSDMESSVSDDAAVVSEHENPEIIISCSSPTSCLASRNGHPALAGPILNAAVLRVTVMLSYKLVVLILLGVKLQSPVFLLLHFCFIISSLQHQSESVMTIIHSLVCNDWPCNRQRLTLDGVLMLALRPAPGAR